MQSVIGYRPRFKQFGHLGLRNTLSLTEGVGSPIPALFATSIALIGDSRAFDTQQHWRNAAITDDLGVDVAAANFAGPGIANATSGTLEWRASDGNVRWTAPSDTAGAWVPLIGGIQILNSGTTGVEKQLELHAFSATGPGTDQSISVSCTGSLYYGSIEYGALARALNLMKWPVMPVLMGIGGMFPSQLADQADWQDAQTPGPGVDIYMIGTNGISESVSAASMLADVEARVVDRVALGRYAVLVGEYARWGVDAVTPMTAPQLAILLEYNAGLASIAARYRGVYVDTYTPTVDTGYTDGRPLAGILRDRVHPTPYGAQVIGAAIANKLLSIGTPYGDLVVSANKWASGVFTTSGGTVRTGVTGELAANHDVVRSSGDLTATASLEDRADGGLGKWQRYVFAATSTSLLQHSGLSTPSLLANLGLSVGDKIEFAIDYDLRDLISVTGIEIFAQFTSVAGPRSIELNINRTGDLTDDEAGTMRAGPVAIPTGATAVRIYMWIRTAGTASGDIRIGNERLELVA